MEPPEPETPRSSAGGGDQAPQDGAEEAPESSGDEAPRSGGDLASQSGDDEAPNGSDLAPRAGDPAAPQGGGGDAPPPGGEAPAGEPQPVPSPLSEDDWATLVHSVDAGRCILMLGPELATEPAGEESRPLTEILASRLAAKIRDQVKEGELLDPYDLPHVARKYAAVKSAGDLRVQAVSFYRKRRKESSQIYTDLAALPFSLVVKTTPDAYYPQACERADKPCSTVTYDFRGDKPGLVKPGSRQQPLVFYLFGSTAPDRSLVLSENDLLDFLVAVISECPPIPANLRTRFGDRESCFLLLGFNFRKWYLRILLHLLQESGRDNRSFAFEEAPSDERALVFYRDEFKLQIFQTSPGPFVEELRRRCEEYNASDTAGGVRLPAELFAGPSVFICHASEDAEQAGLLHEALRGGGLRPWLDREGLRGGDDWDDRIASTIAAVDYFVLVESQALIDKQIGYVNREIDRALSRVPEFRDLSFVLPVRIDEAPRLRQTRKWQAIDLREADGTEQLISAIRRDYQLRKRARE